MQVRARSKGMVFIFVKEDQHHASFQVEAPFSKANGFFSDDVSCQSEQRKERWRLSSFESKEELKSKLKGECSCTHLINRGVLSVVQFYAKHVQLAHHKWLAFWDFAFLPETICSKTISNCQLSLSLSLSLKAHTVWHVSRKRLWIERIRGAQRTHPRNSDFLSGKISCCTMHTWRSGVLSCSNKQDISPKNQLFN